MNLNFFDDNCCEIHCCDGTDFDFPTTNPTIPVLNHCVDVTRRVPVKGVWSWRFLVHFCDAGDPSRCMIPLVVYSADKQVFKNHAQLLNLLLSWRLHEKKRLRIKDKRASVWSEGVLEGTLQSVDRAKDVSNDYTGRIWKGLISIHGEGFVSPDFEDEVIFNIEVYNMQTNIRERCEPDIQRCITLDEDTMDGQVDAALMSMKKGEEAEFCMTQKIYDPSCTGGEQVSSYRCILRLRSFLHISSIGFGFEERVQQGCRRKLEGNDFFRAKKYMSALHKYRRALDFFRADPSASLHCPEVEQKRILTKSQTHNNIALVILVAYGSHLDLDEALEHCNKSINLIPCPLQNDKAFLRRGAIHRTKLNFALAYKDIAVVLEKNPKHTDALREREALLRVEQDTNNQDKKFYAAMMNRLGIQNKKLEADSVSSARRKGVCKAWICKRLCGILNDGVSDYPCNASEIVTQRPIRVLEVGCEVEFGVSTDEVSGEKRAVHVTLPGGEPLPGTDYDTSDRRSGFVVLWDKDRNFGFIRDEIKGEDLFVHVQNVLAFEHPKKVLHVGEPVEYECETDRNGRKRAVRVTAPDGLPVFGAPDSQQSRITIQEELTTRRRHFGLCVKWNPDRRFGFINDEVLGKDIFVHASNLHSTTESQLQLGQRVEYGLEERKDGKLAAIDVRIVEGVHSEACETLNSDQTPFIIHNANCE